MPKVSRMPLRPVDLRRTREVFLKSLALLRTSADVEEFLQDFLTPMEWKMLAKRLAIADMLLVGTPYAEIQQTLKVGTPTIARMQNFLQLHGRGLRKAIEQLRATQRTAPH